MGRPAEMWRYRLAQRVKGLRLMQGTDGYSQLEFARTCGLDKFTIKRIEAGLGCSVEPIVKIAARFGVSSDFLIGLDKVPLTSHEIVDRAYERMASLASSLDFVVSRPYEVTIQDFHNTIDMIERSRQALVDLCFRLRYPDPGNPKLRVPYGYEFVDRMEERLGHDIDG
jgi:DNA-binding XRE family transcriptional regulator